jgi:hypothetical protein
LWSQELNNYEALETYNACTAKTSAEKLLAVAAMIN